MVAAKSAWNYVCPFPKKTTKKTQKQKTNNVIAIFLRNYNLPSSLMLSNSSPFLAWHNIFPYLATSLSILDHYGKDIPTHLILITFFIYIRPEGHYDSNSTDGFLSQAVTAKWGLKGKPFWFAIPQPTRPDSQNLFIQLWELP